MLKEERNYKTKVLWVTNLPAPYRVPIWNRLGETLDLKVVFLLKKQNWRNWPEIHSDKFLITYLSKISLRINQFDLIPNPFGVVKIIRGVQFLIVSGWDTPFYIFLIHKARRRNIPVAIFYESTVQSHRFRAGVIHSIRSRILSLADYVVTSGSDASDAVLRMGIDSKKIITLFNPVDVHRFAEIAGNNRSTSHTGHRFLYVGRLIQRKNIFSLLDAFASIKKPGDSLTIVGDGELAKELQAHVEKIGVSSQVQFMGDHNPERVAQDYANADTLILPSTNEVWGLVVNEALACGLHVVVSQNSGVANFVRDMEGVFISESSTSSIASAMAQSRKNWTNPITNPEILKFTPQKFAEDLIELIYVTSLHQSQSDLIWLTNIPAPYRLPIWHHLNSQLNLNLFFLNLSEKGRKWDLGNDLRGLRWLSFGARGYGNILDSPLYFKFLPLWREIKKKNPASIYIDGWESVPFFVTAYLARKHRIKVIFGYRSTVQSHRFRAGVIHSIRSRILSLADYVVTSGSDASDAVLRMGIDSKKIITLFNPVDVHRFAEIAGNNRSTSHTGHRFLYVGRLIQRKNIFSLLDAFASIKKPGDSLTIVGDGELAKELQAHVEKIGVSSQVQFMGDHNPERVAQDYANADTLILPSTNEVWGLVVNEALACGLHVVVSQNSGVANFVRDMEGVFISESSTSSIASAMAQSRKNWTNPITNPEILKFTPQKFAEDLIELL